MNGLIAPGTTKSAASNRWAGARDALTNWWAGKGIALRITAPKDDRIVAFDDPGPAPSVEARWIDPVWRTRTAQYQVANTFYGGAAIPMFRSDIGPGSLGLFLGCGGHLAPDTVWYDAVIDDPDKPYPMTVDFAGEWWQRHVALLNAGTQGSGGNYLVGFPDLIENIDVLAQMRDPQTTLMDLVERPEWVCERVWEINAAYFAAYDGLLNECGLLDEWGGTTYDCFGIWGIGRTAKVQCDFCCMISPAMFRRFVAPALAEQCKWLTNSLYHLDGEQAIPQVDNLLAIDALNAIQWTPGAGRPGGGSPLWYDLYRRIKAGGKSVQAVGVAVDEVEPLIDAVGADGLMIVANAPNESDARSLLARLGL
ncbi:MAG TPA: hypothetical protein VGK19_18435 [Capsulimonadaceae bacterium]|jgi:hypothetical protein